MSLRVVVGVALIGHGTQKLFGWFVGHGRPGTGAFLELLGNRPGQLFAIAGPGSASLDNAPGLEWVAVWRLGAVALGVAAAIATLLMRRPAAAQPAPASGHDKPQGKAA